MPDTAITRARQTAGDASLVFARPLGPHWGILSGLIMSDNGGLAISWTGGRLRTPAGNDITIVAGSDTCADNAINHLNWASGTALTLSTTQHIHGVGISIGHIACQNGDIWEIHNDPTLSELVPAFQDGLEAIFPLAVASGCLVSEDTDATNPLDVTVSSGTYYLDLHDAQPVVSFDTRTANTLIRCHIDGSGPETWNFTADGAQSEIDVANWNSGTSLISTSVGKYYKGLFVISKDNMFWIYGQEEHNTIAAAIDGVLPSKPPGLELFPRSVAYIYKHGDTAFEAASSDRWIDARPLVTGSVAAGPITDHGELIGLSDDDHTQYWLLAGREQAGTLKANTDFATLINSSNAADMDGTRTSILFRQARLTDTLLDAGRIGFEAADDWTATAGTQDADFVVECREQGVMVEKLRLATDANGGFLDLFCRIDSRRGDGVSNPFRLFAYADADGLSPQFSCRRARGTFASPTAVIVGTNIGNFDFRGYDGTSHQNRASMAAVCDGTVVDVTNTVPMALQFRTGTTTSTTERFTIDSSGDLMIETLAAELHFVTAAEFLTGAAGRMQYNTATGTGHQFRVNSLTVAEIDTDEIRLFGNSLERGSLGWTATAVSLYQAASERLRILAATQSFVGGLLIASAHAAPATSAILELSSTTGAFLASRMTTTQRNALTAVDGMIMFNLSTSQFNFREGGAWVTGSGLA